MNNNPLSAAEYNRLLDHRMHNKKLKTIAFLEKQEKTVNTVAGFTLIGIIGICDFLMGYEIAFSLFYVLPIAFLLWFTGKKPVLSLHLSVRLFGCWLIKPLGMSIPL